MTKKEGFWVRLFIEYGRGHTVTEETYVYLTHEAGYDEKDEESLRLEAENWANHDNRGYALDRYKYGFEIVPKPPKEWLEKELDRLEEEIESLMAEEDLIKSEL